MNPAVESREHHHRLLVALVAVLAIVVGVGASVDAHASTQPALVAGTRVAVHEQVDRPLVEVDDDVLAGEGRRTTTHAADHATGSRVAPNTAMPDFVAGPVGSAPPVPVSQSRMAAGLDDAGFPRQPTTSPGMDYTLPDGSHVRLMDPAGTAGRRASFTNANGQPVNPFTGKPVQPPPGLTSAERLEYVRARTHVEQGL